MSRIAFVLFQTGETRALSPAIRTLAEDNKHQLLLIPIGQPAKHNLPQHLNALFKVPLFIQQGLGQNDASSTALPKQHIDEIVTLCKQCDTVVIGFSSTIAEQVACALPSKQQRIVYFDCMNHAPLKVSAFMAYADTLIMTTHEAKKQTEQQILKASLKKNPKVLAARHGDFDTWLSSTHKSTTYKKELRQKLHVTLQDNLIVWAGSYGDLSPHDKEAEAFKTFLKAYAPFSHVYQLRITLHPGLKNYTKAKLKSIIKTYYLDALKAFDIPQKYVITTLETRHVASLAKAVVSFASRAGAQALFIGVEAKNVFIKRGPTLKGIESVKTLKRWQTLLKQWSQSKPRALPASRRLSLPAKTTVQALNSAIK